MIYSAANKPLWTSPTAGHPGSRLEVRNDGKLAVVAPDGKTLWSAP